MAKRAEIRTGRRPGAALSIRREHDSIITRKDCITPEDCIASLQSLNADASPAPEPEHEKYPITLWRVLGWAAKICLMPLMLIIEWRQRRLLRTLHAAEAAGEDSFTFGRIDYVFYSGCKPQNRVKPPR